MNTIIASLKKDACPYRKIRSFSEKPGIYAIFFTGKDFPLTDYTPREDEIIYIGKTESSQASRDEKTHFTSGKTGSSTIRRSLGALLKKELSLIPVLRNDKDFDAGRKSFFKFDEPSEERLTKWMKDNLGISFYENEKPPSELDVLETGLIAETKPLLNIDSKNPGNPYAPAIKAARKACADEANQIIAKQEITDEPVKTKVVPFRVNSVAPGQNAHKYEEIFNKALPQIENTIDNSGTRKLSIQLSQEDFKKVGNRQSYSFNLEFSDGVVANDIGGSAVARDLARVLEQNPGIAQKMKGRHLKFNMDKGFTLWISNK
ncbi:MAG: hypothetical protein NT040_11035 [Bacteroidetes bacterium]|nr:hypothetical protein [Bacteroidota bacterium]